MSEQELRKLQIYISKRSKGQTDEQVINHITKINNKTPLTQEEWHELIFPSCNNGYVEILRFILSNIQCLNNVKEYMRHTVYGRNKNINDERIEILKECLNETMIYAAWFGETRIVKFLIENGANKEYKTQNGLGLLECSERVEKLFEDSSLKEFIENNQ